MARSKRVVLRFARETESASELLRFVEGLRYAGVTGNVHTQGANTYFDLHPPKNTGNVEVWVEQAQPHFLALGFRCARAVV